MGRDNRNSQWALGYKTIIERTATSPRSRLLLRAQIEGKRSGCKKPTGGKYTQDCVETYYGNTSEEMLTRKYKNQPALIGRTVKG